MYLDKVKGIITENDYLEIYREFTLKKAQAEQFTVDNEKQLEDIEARIAKGGSRKDIIDDYINMDCLSREAVEELIDHISVGRRIPGTLEIPIEIHWQF